MRLFWRREDEAAGRAEQPTRTIVFSTFVKALDLLERRLEGTGIGVLRLDGGIRTVEMRSQVVRQFAHDPQVRSLLTFRIFVRTLRNSNPKIP